MKLIPKRPLGRPNRKALAFEAEIARMRLEGYPCEAIWEALVEAGVKVSRSSVKREVARLARRATTPSKSVADVPKLQAQSPKAATTVLAPVHPDDSPSGKEVAEAWMEGRITNPLIRARISHESSRH